MALLVQWLRRVFLVQFFPIHIHIDRLLLWNHFVQLIVIHSIFVTLVIVQQKWIDYLTIDEVLLPLSLAKVDVESEEGLESFRCGLTLQAFNDAL